MYSGDIEEMKLLACLAEQDREPVYPNPDPSLLVRLSFYQVPCYLGTS